MKGLSGREKGDSWRAGLRQGERMPGISLRADWDAERVRRVARLAEDAAQVRRLLAIAAVYDGMSRAAASRLGGMDRQTLRDWVHRFNATGPSGLVDRTASGAAPRLTPDQESELAALVEAGPEPVNLPRI